MNNEGIFDIALFPIPGSVSFPQTIVPLHVFEPRYRKMIQDCISKKRLLGVCHTKSIERFAPSQTKQIKDREELYKLYRQNLTTFSPEDVFSAGPVEINEETEDGRFVISIFMLKRFRIIDIIQDSPYKIAKCEEYLDDTFLNFTESSREANKQREFILNSIERRISNVGKEILSHIEQVKSERSVNDFTFKVFRFVRMSEYEMQNILNSKNPLMRLSSLFSFFEKL